MAKLLLFDGNFKTIECEELEDYHKHLQCNVFDVVTANVGGRRYDIFCDDEGLFKEARKLRQYASDLMAGFFRISLAT